MSTQSPNNIIQFPKPLRSRVPPRRSRGLELVASWDKNFYNPYLSSVYGYQVSYVERWYLETRNCMLQEQPSNIVRQLALDTPFCDAIIRATQTDLKMCTDLLQQPEYVISAEYWIKKLVRWSGLFLACSSLVERPNSLDKLKVPGTWDF